MRRGAGTCPSFRSLFAVWLKKIPPSSWRLVRIFLLYTFKSRQSIIEFNINLCSLSNTQTIIRCFFIIGLVDNVLIFALFSVKRGSVGNTRLLPKCCLFQWIVFLWRVNYALEENVLTDFCRLFHTARSWHAYIYWFTAVTLFLVGMNRPLMQKHFLWPLLKCKALHCG